MTVPKDITESSDQECVFCKIATGKITPRGNGIIWEDQKHLAWLSPFPNTQGLTVLIPKKHFDSDVLKMPNEPLQELILAAKQVSQLLINYFPDVGRVGLIMEGTGVNHAHIKLFPMHGTGYMKSGEWRQHSSDREDYFEEYQGFLMSNDGPQADFEELVQLAKEIRENNK